MKTYDVVVCGAGPAGSIAARNAAQRGLKVALIEKDKLPRNKTCGGGMPSTVSKYLQGLDPSTFVESRVKYMRHTWDFSNPSVVPINSSGPEDLSIWMVQRRIFDNALAMQAVDSGVELLDGLTVSSIERGNGEIKIRATQNNNGADFITTSKYLIGADGAKGQIAKTCGLRNERRNATAIEVEYPHEWGKGHPELRPDIMHLEYAIPGGYAWVFPKRDHLNVGAGVVDKRFLKNQTPRELIHNAISRYLHSLQVTHNINDLVFHAHPVPLWNGCEPLHTADGQILLVGDAAGLVNPFFCDGIFNGIVSGSIAAECVASDTVDQYTGQIHDKFGSHFDASERLGNLFYRFSRLLFPIIKRPNHSHHAMEMLCGETPRLSNSLKQAVFNWMFGFKSDKKLKADI